MAQQAKPVIVLIHGAFADASGWSDVFHSLRDRGYQVYAPANPLRGIAGDAEYIRSFISTIDGPVVLPGTPTAVAPLPTPAPAWRRSRRWSTSRPTPRTKARRSPTPARSAAVRPT